jgi:small subunit ribosomal protein S5
MVMKNRAGKDGAVVAIDDSLGVVLPEGSWVPKTEIGKRVLKGEITDIEQIISTGKRILESQIVDKLVPEIESDLLLIGQSKGKFGGGQRRAFKQTQKKTKEGNKPKFTTMAVVGNRNGIVGLAMGSSKETVPAREKAVRNAKLNLLRIPRGYAGPDLIQGAPHTVPFRVIGKCGSCEVILAPAPRGSGLVCQKECAKILRLAGIKDVYSKTYGNTTTRMNLMKACMDALLKLSLMKVRDEDVKRLGIVYGRLGKSDE